MLLAADPEALSADDAAAGGIGAELAGRLLHGLQLRYLAAAAGQRREKGELSSVGQELSAATGLHPTAASVRTDLGCSAVARLPMTLKMLEAGTLRPCHVELVERATRDLSDEQAHAVDAAVPPGPLGLKKRLAKALTAIDPDHLRKKAEKAVADRTVDFWTDSVDGVGGVGFTGPIERIAQIKAAIDSHARQPLPGDDRPLGARRFDVLFGWARSVLGLDSIPTATGTATNTAAAAATDTDAAAAAVTATAKGACHSCGRTGPPTVPINVTISLEALLRLSEAPGDLDGNPIPAEVARELAADGRWRRWVVEAATGRLLDVGAATYRPGAALARFVRGRARTCGFPSCSIRSDDCDLDHVDAFHTEGGETVQANLAPHCRSHHRLKHETDWRYELRDDGGTDWTAPSGRGYRKEPDYYGDDPELSAYLTGMSERRRQREQRQRERQAAARRGPVTADWNAPGVPDDECPF